MLNWPPTHIASNNGILCVEYISETSNYVHFSDTNTNKAFYLDKQINIIMSEHNGAIVEKVIRREGHSLTDLAKITGVNRRSIYNWFLQPRLKPEIIIRIGRAIKHDFSVEFPKQFVPDDFKVEAKAELFLNTYSEEKIDVWKEKYIDLLERYNLLLTRKKATPSTCIDNKFNVLFVNNRSNEYKIDLRNSPSELFLEKCKKAGYKIKCINRAELPAARCHEYQNHKSTQTT